MSLPYSKEQQIHCLSWLSNAAFGLKEPNFDTLQNLTTNIVENTLADSDIHKTIGSDWQLLWGPVVFSNSQHVAEVVADNTMMLLYSKSQNLFVVGIAGTNAVSVFGWLQEDFKVNRLVHWGSIVNKTIIELIQPSVSEGTATGLNELLSMTNKGQTLIAFLGDYLKSENIPAGAEVAVTGHSLGGALSPTFAMYLQDTIESWNANGAVKVVSAWPTAGPTPGNAAFATYVEKHLPSYTAKYNPIDVVPQAWERDCIETIPGIYKQGLTPPESAAPFETFIGTLVTAVFLNTINKADYLPIEYTHIQPRTALPGSAFDKATNDKMALKLDIAGKYEPAGLKPYVPYLRNLACFLAQAAYQHTVAYNSLLNIEEFANDFKEIKAKLTGKTEEDRLEDALHEALHKYFGMRLPFAKLVDEVL